MDTSDYPSLPNLAQLHARLASNSRRVEAVVDAQLNSMERLFSATTAEDWVAVAETSRYLADLEPDQVGADVVRHARRVYEELSHGSTVGKPPKHLAGLLAACHAAGKRRTTA